jgi:hypothetical protein
MSDDELDYLQNRMQKSSEKLGTLDPKERENLAKLNEKK